MQVFPHILLVEDHPDSRSLLCELLGMLGYEVCAVDDAEQAWLLLNTQSFDVLLTDISLPGMSGLVLASKALRVTPALHVILSTGYDLGTLEQIGFPATILLKPYDVPALRAALVHRAVNGKQT